LVRFGGKLAQEIKRHAESKGFTAGQFAVAWLLNSAFVCSVIAGPRTEEQWDDYVRALDYPFAAEDEARSIARSLPAIPPRRASTIRLIRSRDASCGRRVKGWHDGRVLN
jgi:aryl-alcohol dehydrogenase-like predicted oxidoreductase